MNFLNVYSITRHFGGHEEGGWWYDWYECVEVFPVRDSEQGMVLKDWLYEQHKSKAYGNISSVLGGLEIVVRFEDEPKKSETKERPHYE